MTDPAALLAAHRPVMQYDSHEPYLADFAGIISDRPGNTLCAADGTVLATASRTLALLGRLRPVAEPVDGRVPQATDHLKETGGDYQAQAAEMHARPGYANRIHGRLTTTAAGTTWLQYWFIMYYDDPGLLGTDVGVHEGDMEMIQLALDADGSPVTAVYAHHRSGYRVAYDQLERQDTPQGPAPVVFSARGSHASMLRAGHQRAGSVVPDRNDGRGPRVRPELVVLDPPVTPWAWWPGSWGGTRAKDGELGRLGIEANSPTAFTAHAAWRDPDAFAAACAVPAHLTPAGQPLPVAADGPPAPPAPQLSVSRDGDQLAVAYDATAAAAAAADRLTVATRAAGSDDPARIQTVDIGGAPTGTVRLPAPEAGAEVHASARRADGPPSDTTSTAL